MFDIIRLRCGVVGTRMVLEIFHLNVFGKQQLRASVKQSERMKIVHEAMLEA